MKQEYLDKIFKILSGVDDTWVLNVVYKFVIGMTK